MGINCKIIFEKKSKYNKEINELIIELRQAGVQLKTYPENDEDNIRNIKGQFKLNSSGNYECLVIGNQNFYEEEDKFKLFDMNNRFLSKILWNVVEEFFKNNNDVEEVILGEEK